MFAVETTVSQSSSTVDGTSSIENGINSPDAELVCGPNARTWDILPDDVWLLIFPYLELRSLFSAENVCERWKKLVDVHLKSRRQLTIAYSRQNVILHSDVVRVLSRCGSQLRQLTVRDATKYYKRGMSFKIISLIGEYCPNLIELSIFGETIVTCHGLRHLALNCTELQHLHLAMEHRYQGWFLSETFGFMLKSLQQLRQLEYKSPSYFDYLNHIGPMVEVLEWTYIYCLPPSLFLDYSTKFKNLRKLSLRFMSGTGIVDFNGFSEACVNLKELSIENAPENSEMLIEISKMLWLLWLDFSYNLKVDDNSVELLVHGSPDLKTFKIMGHNHSQISDAGVKHIVGHCPQLVDLDISGNDRVTDLSLACVAECGIIRCMRVRGCELITDVGCIDLVTRCPQLELLDIRHCRHITNAILLPCLVAVQKRCDKLPLKLLVAGTKITEVRMNLLDQYRLIIEYEF